MGGPGRAWGNESLKLGAFDLKKRSGDCQNNTRDVRDKWLKVVEVNEVGGVGLFASGGSKL